MFARLAAALEYPDEGLGEQLDALLAETAAERPEAAEVLDGFRSAIAGLTLDRLREIYAATFDLNPACCLFAGYHLFGDSYKRGALMAGLNGEYRARGFDPGNELPDHLSVLLRFLAVLDDSELRSALLEELLLPALTRIVKSFEGTGNVYAALTRAVLLGLRPDGYATSRELTRALPVLGPEEGISGDQRRWKT